MCETQRPVGLRNRTRIDRVPSANQLRSACSSSPLTPQSQTTRYLMKRLWLTRRRVTFCGSLRRVGNQAAKIRFYSSFEAYGRGSLRSPFPRTSRVRQFTFISMFMVVCRCAISIEEREAFYSSKLIDGSARRTCSAQRYRLTGWRVEMNGRLYQREERRLVGMWDVTHL